MKVIRNLNQVRMLPDIVIKKAMLARAELCHDGDEEILAEMEEEFNGPLGGDWYVFEEGDVPRSFEFDDGCPVDLLSEEWQWCDDSIHENGCYFVFWGTNNAGGPCLFAPDEPWLPADLRLRLEELIASV